MVTLMSDPLPTTAHRDQTRTTARLLPALLWPFLGVSALWLVAAVQGLTGIDYVGLGVFPRTLAGLAGVLTAPLIHESWGHLVSNSVPLLGLGIIAMYGYPHATRYAVPLIWLLSGLGVWLLGRESFHIGISGLTHGLMFFVVVIGFMRRDRLSIALALIVFLLFGGMVSGVIPQEPTVSFEYHLFGAIAGTLSALMLHRIDPRPPGPPPEPPPDADEDFPEPAGPVGEDPWDHQPEDTTDRDGRS
jgi:membrane associated rhomboid family serine protease